MWRVAVCVGVCLTIACDSAKAPAPAPAPAPAAAGELDVHVDRRVELMSILQRLVQAREYMATPATKYVADVDAHFAAFRDHPAVAATRELREQHGIGFDGPMWLAVQLDDKLAVRAPPTDPRWAKVDIEAYVAKLRDFAAASKLDEFLAAHRPYLAKVETRLRELIQNESPVTWFDGFFGKRPGARFVVVPGMLVGTHNFGPHTATELFQIIGVVRVDFDELPQHDALTTELVVHEMAHAYINPLFAAHATELAPHGERLFARVAEPMRKQAYPTWQIFLNEQGVRAVTTLYLRERKGAAAGKAAGEREVARGFLWTPALADLFASYAAKRQQYSDLERFMPEIVRFFAAIH